ncbi:high-mobility group box 1a [Tritrichomonas foetus]|uniref:High-mobility group box 1a n=1 Tax=Tritrichomonas foetus TaxID=1144522 RepID=A0A1J4KEF1_9EUKA|nr:high-mobility group box 1a [Tritrichomonas foetus]|eukprot:OHT09571.1 high-mobility group box 1a [Tritrichomonas foetus]
MNKINDYTKKFKRLIKRSHFIFFLFNQSEMSYESSRKRSAWNFFLKEKCAELKEQFPDAQLNELSQRAGEIWKNMTQEERETYERMSVNDKARRDEIAREKYIEKKKAERKKSGNDTFDISKSPYFLFMNEMHAEIKENEPTMNYDARCDVILTLWNEMTIEERERYNYDDLDESDEENLGKRKSKKVKHTDSSSDDDDESSGRYFDEEEEEPDSDTTSDDDYK